MSDEKDYTGEITSTVRFRDFLEGDWTVPTEVKELPDGSWEATALEGKYKETGYNSAQAMERLHEKLYQEGLKGGY